MKLNCKELPTDIRPQLYLYMCSYKFIKTINSDKEFNKAYPNLKYEILKILSKPNLVVKTRNELKCIKLRSDNLIYFTVKETKTLSFLRHLRNAIAHDNIIYNTDLHSYIIHDYDKGNLTAIGQISENKLNTLIKLLIKTL